MWWRGSSAAVVAGIVFSCVFHVLPASAQGQLDPNPFGKTPTSTSDGSIPNSNTGGGDKPIDAMALLRHSFKIVVPLSPTGSPEIDSARTSLGYASAATGSVAYVPTSLPAESGINYTLSPLGGYANLGSGTGAKAVGGSSGSIAFPIGHSFGLLTDFTAASIGGSSLYAGGTNFYWRDPSIGLVGADVHGGHYAGFGGANFGSGGLSTEGYFGRWTPFAKAGAFAFQSSPTHGYASIGTAYYPTDNLQLSISVSDYGGFTSGHAGVEYLLPKSVTSFSGVATTVSLNGSVGNHGTSALLAKLKFMFGPSSTNNKTLIERRRQDDYREEDDELAGGLNGWINRILADNKRQNPAPAVSSTSTSAKACTDGQVISGCTCSGRTISGNVCAIP